MPPSEAKLSSLKSENEDSVVKTASLSSENPWVVFINDLEPLNDSGDISCGVLQNL